MKGYYLFAPIEPGCLGENSGVEKKVRSQHKALQKYLDCELVILPIIKYSGSVGERIIRRLPFTAAWRKWNYQSEFNDADYLYIRSVNHDASFVRYLRKIKKQNEKVKIIYEIPTYPYGDDQRYTLSNFMFLIKERVDRLRSAKYMDRIVTFYGQDEIWGVPCIKLMNGFDFSAVKLPSRETPNAISMITVATTAKWHGYDRIIEGIRQYYDAGGKENIIYHMVGDALPELSDLVERYCLQEHVIIHGKCYGNELYELYRKCFLGFDVLAGHRINSYSVSSTLKSREYGAYGIPLITASKVDFMDDDCPYQMLVPDDESPIDMGRIIAFYHLLYDGKDCNTVAWEIRNYAETRCDMSITMKPVVNWLTD